MAGTVSIWLRPEPFTFGALPVAHHRRLSVINIKRLVSYAKNKGKTGYPNLSYAVWKHIAVNKLQLPIDLAWMFFSQFELVGGDMLPGQLRDLDNQFAAVLTTQEHEELRQRLSVPTLKFVLFLYIQQLHKIQLRAAIGQCREEWPSRAPSPELEGARSGSGKGLDEHGHMMFVTKNLSEIVELLLEPDSYSGGRDAGDKNLSVDALQALGFLLTGSMDGGRTVKPLDELALSQQLQANTGYSKLTRSFSMRKLSTWIRDHLAPSPFGISSCLATGRRLSWPLAGEDKEARLETRGRIATNAHMVPKDAPPGEKLIIMSQVCKQTVARSSGTVEGSAVKIHRCYFSYIYLLSPLRSVSVEKCRNSTIVLGSVTTSLHVSHCDNCVIIAPTRRLIVSGSSACTLHVLTPTRPLLLSGNEGLMLAPYHTHYPTLEEHMARAGLDATLNLWDQPLLLTHGQEQPEESRCYEIMSPRDFYPFTVPFEMEGTTKEIPGRLPTRYERAVTQRQQRTEKFQELMRTANLAESQSKTFHGIIETRFQEWLQDSGHQREIKSLAPDSRSKHLKNEGRPEK